MSFSENQIPQLTQPDGDLLPQKTDGSAFSTSATLSADAVYLSDWIDTDGWATIEIFVKADVPSAFQGIELEFTDDVQAVTPTAQAIKKYSFSEINIRNGFKQIRVPTLLDGFRLRYTNDGIDQSSFYLNCTLRSLPENTLVNNAGAVIINDFFTEIALGNVSNYSDNVKFGIVRDVDIGDGSVDVVSAGSSTPGDYTGFNATANQDLQVLSSDANDQGLLVTSGNVTTASSTQLIDSTATFITDGVAVEDIILVDTQGIHAYVTSVDSETTLTVREYFDGNNGLFSTNVGSAYRIVNANDTGAAVLEISAILNSDYETQPKEFAILNGTTPVTVACNAFRVSRAKVLLAGPSGSNEGDITIRQASTTANVFAVIPIGANQTLNAAATVPANQIFLIKNLTVALVRANGADGSAFVSFRIREPGGVFQAKRFEAISTSFAYNEAIEGGLILRSGTDYKFRVESVSDNNSEISATLEHLTILR